MADLSITASSVIAGTTAKKVNGTSGATITAGKVVYLDEADNRYKLADNNGVAAALSPVGIALHAASSGQPLTVAFSGPVTIGATLTAGNEYLLSATAGGICPRADVTTGQTVVSIGYATSTTVLNVNIQVTGVTL